MEGTKMKQTIKTSRTAGYLEKLFRTLNERYFDNSIEELIITIQSTPRAYGHITVAKAWRKGNGDLRHELNIAAGTLDRPIEEIVATVLHEMVHLANLQAGVRDCSRSGTYHNKRFKTTAEACDLRIEYDPRIGWSVTSPTEALIDFIISNGWEDIRMSREDGCISRTPGRGSPDRTPTTPTTPKKSSTRKYICPGCKMSVRATREVNIICGDCGLKMVRV